MKSKLLLYFGLCIALVSCKDDEPATPARMHVSISSNSQTLVEGGDVVEVTVELDREYDEVKYMYLDYGANNGEHPNFFESSLRKDSIQVRVPNNTTQVQVLRIPFLAGEKQKVIRLKSVEDDMYRGNRPLELKVLSYEYGGIQHRAQMELGFEEKNTKPVFGIPADLAAQELVVKSKDGTTALILPITVTGLFQFPQTVKIVFSGTAKMGVDYEKREATIVLPPNKVSPIVTSHYGFLGVYHDRDYSTPKTIQITLSDAEEGEISNGQEFEDFNGNKLVLQDTFTLTITE